MTKEDATRNQRQQAWRDRNKASAGGPEVRGIFAPKPHHPAIKEAARKAAAKLAKEPKT